MGHLLLAADDPLEDTIVPHSLFILFFQ